jgi:hypothetical protein
MGLLLSRERRVNILHVRDRRPVELLVIGKIEAIEKAILRRYSHKLLAAHRLDQSGR